MRKRIRESLCIKVFLVTMLLLSSMGMLAYGMLAVLMPKTYSNTLNENLDRLAETFISELKKTEYQDSGGLFAQFLQMDDIRSVELYAEHGGQVPVPSEKTSSLPEYLESEGQESWDGVIQQQYSIAYSEEEGEGSPILSNSYYFSFQGEKARYMLKVYGEAGELAELQASFLRVLPALLGAVLGASLLASWLFSYAITRPVLKISRISQEMSELNLDWQLGSPRPDEQGKLESSLHFFSQKLAAAILD